QARSAVQLLGELAADRVGDVDLAALERREPRRLVGDRTQHDTLDARGLAPIALKRLEYKLDPRRERYEFVRPRADWRFLEPVDTDLLDILLGHDPAGASGARIEGEEVGPRLFEGEADPPGIDGVDRSHPVLHQIV